MARVIFAARAEADLERLYEFLAAEDAAAANAVVALILDAISVLERHPLIGRAADDVLRELVVSRGRTGYVALYRYFVPEDVVMVVRLRHQREAGYPEVE